MLAEFIETHRTLIVTMSMTGGQRSALKANNSFCALATPSLHQSTCEPHHLYISRLHALLLTTTGTLHRFPVNAVLGRACHSDAAVNASPIMPEVELHAACHHIAWHRHTHLRVSQQLRLSQGETPKPRYQMCQ
jgi:hypothetical protein